MEKQVTILGSTGSVGTQSLEVCRKRGFQVVALSGNKNVKLLAEQAREFSPHLIGVADESSAKELRLLVSDLPVRVVSGTEGVEEVARYAKTDIVVNSISGIAGLRPTLAVLESEIPLALSNKEALVVGGSLVMSLAQERNVPILPVDSEHSAIWQALRSGSRQELDHIILTASGGPFFGKTKQELEAVTVKDALAHPTWTMGQKISIDSATLMNKGLEIIEAMWLFDLSVEQIQVVVHRQSVIHSAVAFVDGSVIAQMGSPDMQVPIQYALTYPERQPLDTKPLSLTDYGTLTFEKPDLETFTCLKTCIEAGKQGGFAPCVANGANEEAVALFLQHKLSFLQIGEFVSQAVQEVQPKGELNLESLEEADQSARDYIRKKAER